MGNWLNENMYKCSNRVFQSVYKINIDTLPPESMTTIGEKIMIKAKVLCKKLYPATIQTMLKTYIGSILR